METYQYESSCEFLNFLILQKFSRSRGMDKGTVSPRCAL